MTFTRAFWTDNTTPPGVDATNLNRIEQGIVDVSVGQAPVPIKQVKVATTANITLSGAQTIDGVAVVAGDRVLVKNQSTASQNGVYDASAGAWTRSADASSSTTLVPSTLVVVERGTTQLDQIWMLTTDGPITVGTTALTFARPTFPSTTATTSQQGSVLLSASSTTVLSTNDPAFETHLSGLDLRRDGARALTVKKGALWIPSLGRIYNVANDIPIAGMTMTANTWYYLYLYDTSGTPTLEYVTTAPSVYKGYAATKAGDNSRRFVGAIRSNSTSDMYNWVWEPDGWMRYIADTISTTAGANPQIVFSSSMGSTSVYANISLAALVPPTTQLALMQIKPGSGSQWALSIPGQSIAMHTFAISTRNVARVDLDTSQQYAHLSPDSSAGLATHYLLGYKENR